MSLRAMYRVVMAFLLVAMPLLGEILTPAQTQASSNITPSQTVSADPPQDAPKAPTVTTQASVAAPPTFCNYHKATNTGGDVISTGIWGQVVVRSTNATSDALVRLYDVTDSNNIFVVGQVRTNEAFDIGNVAAVGQFQFGQEIVNGTPNSYYPSFNNTIRSDHKYKILFIPRGYENNTDGPASPITDYSTSDTKTYNPVWYGDATNISTSITIGFNDQCQMINVDQTPPAQIAQANQGAQGLLDPLSSVAGRVVFRQDNTTPIPGVSVAIYSQNNPNAPVVTAASGPNGAFTSGQVGSLPAGNYYVKYTATGFTTSWYLNKDETGGQPPANRDVVVVANPTTPCTGNSPSASAYNDCGYVVLQKQSLIANYSISGTVTGSAGAPLEQVVVNLYNAATGTQLTSATTAANGTYKIDNVAPGIDYKLQFVPPTGTNLPGKDYLTEFWSTTSGTPDTTTDATTFGPNFPPVPPLVINDAAVSKFKISVGASPATPYVKNIQLIKGAGISGTVTRSDGGTALPSIAVELYNVSGAQPLLVGSVTTDSNGFYQFDKKYLAGDYKLRFVPDVNSPYSGGYWINSTTTDPVNATVTTLAVGDYGNNNFVTRNVVLQRGATINGTITAPASLAGGLGANQISIQINIINAANGQSVRIFSVGPNANQTNYTYTTPALPTGNNYKVLFTPVQNGGTSIVGGLRSVYYSDSSATGTSSIATATVINIPAVQPAPTINGINVTLTQGARINVSVKTNQTPPQAFPNVLVRVLDDNDNIVSSDLTTDSNGNAVIDFLPASTNLKVALFPPQFGGFSYGSTFVLNPQAPCQGPQTANTPCILKLNAGTQASVTATLTPSRNVFGTFLTSPAGDITDWTNTKIEVFRVDSGASVPISITANTIQNLAGGTASYQFDLQSGLNYIIKFTPPNSAYLPQYYNNAYQYNTATVVAVDASSTGQVKNDPTTFTKGGAFFVTASYKTGGVVNNATVKIYDASKNLILSGPIDSNGQFTHRPLPTGSANYYVSIKPADSSYDEQFYPNTFDIAKAQPVQLTAGNGKLTPLVFTLERPAALKGNVFLQNTPTSDNQTDFTSANDGTFTVNLYAQADPSRVLYTTTTTGAGPTNGAFNFPLIAEGNYIIEIKPSNTQANPNLYPIAYYDGSPTQVTIAPPDPNAGTVRTMFYGQNAANPGSAPAVFVRARTNASDVNVISQTYTRSAAGLLCEIKNVIPGVAGQTNIQLSFNVTANNVCLGDGGASFGTTTGTYTNNTSRVDTGAPGTLSHSLNITSLQPNTTYYIKPDSIPVTGGQAQKFSYKGEVTLRTSSDGKAWYFAAGNSDGANSEVFHIINPTGAAASITLTYYTDGATPGSASVAQPPVNKTVPAGERLDVVTPATGIGAHATIVQSSNQSVMVERTIYGTQNITNGAASGGYTLPGATGTSSKAFFPDGNNATDTDVYYSIFNPGNNPILIAVQYLPTNNTTGQFNTSPTNPTITIPALSRFRFGLKGVYGPNPAAANGAPGLPPGSRFGVVFLGIGNESTFIAEQEVYYRSSDRPQRKGYTGSVGIPADQSSWNFVDAIDDKITDNVYTFINGQPTDAVVTLNYTLDNPAGVIRTETVSVPKYSRVEKVLPQNASNGSTSQVGRNFGFTLRVSAADAANPNSPRPIVVQRNVKYRWRLTPGSDGIFVEPSFTRFATRWQFAGGDTMAASNGNNFTDVSYSIYNTSNSVANITITYYRVSAPPIVVPNVQVASGSRLVIQPAISATGITGIGYNGIAGVQFDSVCTGNGCQPAQIAVERTMYWSKGNIVGGNSIFGFIPPDF